MRSTRKFARGAKKNYAFFITFSLKFWKISPPPPAINIWKISPPPTIPAFPPPPPINIWKIFQPPRYYSNPPSISVQKSTHLG